MADRVACEIILICILGQHTKEEQQNALLLFFLMWLYTHTNDTNDCLAFYKTNISIH